MKARRHVKLESTDWIIQCFAYQPYETGLDVSTSKYEQLELPYGYARREPPSPDLMMTLKKVYETRGLACYLGSNTPF